MQLSTPYKYFFVDQNRLGRDASPRSDSDSPYQLLSNDFSPHQKNVAICHISQFIKSTHQQVDDDTLLVPQWILDKMGLKPGEPVCLTLDLKLLQNVKQILPLFLKNITLMPLQKDYENLAK